MEQKNIKSAIAIAYGGGNINDVKIIAAGKGKMAASLLDAAMKSDVPIYENPELYDKLCRFDIFGDISQEISPAVSEILSFVYSKDAEKSAIIHGSEN